jgi:hypothetical protein
LDSLLLSLGHPGGQGFFMADYSSVFPITLRNLKDGAGYHFPEILGF